MPAIVSRYLTVCELYAAAIEKRMIFARLELYDGRDRISDGLHRQAA